MSSKTSSQSLKFLTFQVLKLLNSPKSSNFLLPPPWTWNKQDVKLVHKTLIQHNCQKQQQQQQNK